MTIKTLWTPIFITNSIIDNISSEKRNLWDIYTNFRVSQHSIRPRFALTVCAQADMDRKEHLCENLRTILHQIHHWIIWTHAPIEEISHERNLTFHTKQLTWSISFICLLFNRDLEIVGNISNFKWQIFDMFSDFRSPLYVRAKFGVYMICWTRSSGNSVYTLTSQNPTGLTWLAAEKQVPEDKHFLDKHFT